ncbi:MAG: hypothetical protein ACREQ5_24500, partial [Candidatus Dormibacteria bacterium]
VEDGVIWKSISPMIYKEMMKRGAGNWINFQPIASLRDKATRGRDLQKRMRAGSCRFDKDADWYAPFEEELRRFTGMSDAVLDDQFDSAALIAKGLNLFPELDEEDFDTEEELDMRKNDPRKFLGRNHVTGY